MIRASLVVFIISLYQLGFAQLVVCDFETEDYFIQNYQCEGHLFKGDTVVYYYLEKNEGKETRFVKSTKDGFCEMVQGPKFDIDTIRSLVYLEEVDQIMAVGWSWFNGQKQLCSQLHGQEISNVTMGDEDYPLFYVTNYGAMAFVYSQEEDYPILWKINSDGFQSVNLNFPKTVPLDLTIALGSIVISFYQNEFINMTHFDLKNDTIENYIIPKEVEGPKFFTSVMDFKIENDTLSTFLQYQGVPPVDSRFGEFDFIQDSVGDWELVKEDFFYSNFEDTLDYIQDQMFFRRFGNGILSSPFPNDLSTKYWFYHFNQDGNIYGDNFQVPGVSSTVGYLNYPSVIELSDFEGLIFGRLTDYEDGVKVQKPWSYWFSLGDFSVMSLPEELYKENQIFPNPTSSLADLEGFKGETIYAYDSYGKLFWTGKDVKEIRERHEGIYFLVTSEGTFKIIVNDE